MIISHASFKARFDLEALPEFELGCLFDDAENPNRLTIFSPEIDRGATEWITVEESTAVSIDEVR